MQLLQVWVCILDLGIGGNGMSETQLVNVICSSNLPVEILNEETQEFEKYHMIQEGDTFYVSEEIYQSLKKQYGVIE